MVAEDEGPAKRLKADDTLDLVLPGGELVLASMAALASRSAFFAPLAADDAFGDAGRAESGASQAATWGEAELVSLAGALCPGSRAALPAVLRVLGEIGSEPRWGSLFEGAGLLHAFAVAHLLGAADLLDAARDEWAVACERSLAAVLVAVDAEADAACLRTAADHGLDMRRPLKLLHAAAIADAAAACQVLAIEGDVPGAESCCGVAPVDARDALGRTPLHACAIHDSASAAAALIHASAAIDALCDPPEDEDEDEGESEETNRGDAPAAADSAPQARGVRTPLHLAALHDSSEVVQLLLDRKANVAACVRGRPGAVTPLHECACADAGRAARVLAAAAAAAAISDAELWAIATGAKPASQPESAEVPAAGDPAAEDAEAAEVEWSRFLDPLHAKVGAIGSTPLHAAAECDAPAVATALLEAKADPNIGDDHGDTPVHIAMLYGSPRALAELLARGGEALRANGSGELPLHLAAEFGPGAEAGDVELSPFLVRRHYARSIRALEGLVEELKNRGQLESALTHEASGDLKNTPLHAVARHDHFGAVHAVQLLARLRADLERKNGEGRTALGMALRRHGPGGKVAAALGGLGAAEPAAEQKAQEALESALGGCVRQLAPAQAPGPESPAGAELPLAQ